MATSRICSVEGCEKGVLARGWCRRHYTRWRDHGDPTGGRTPPGSAMSWIELHKHHQGEECLTWPFALATNGYGSIMYRGRNTNAHRVMCIAAHGEPPKDGLSALHSCGKGHEACVHPGHVRWGTQKENRDDMNEHGTVLIGDLNPASRLRPDDIRAIRASLAPQKDLADTYGVTPNYIGMIRRRVSWSWLK